LSRVVAVPLAPVLVVQGRRLRRSIPKLPDAALPWDGYTAGPNPLRLLVLGDSTAAGVGVESQADGLVGSLAAELVTRSGRGVDWRAIGENGANARNLIDRFLDRALEHEYEFVFLSVGANDALGLRSRLAFSRDIRRLLTALRERNPQATILMSSLPAFFRFTALPEPLRWNLYLHSQSLEQAARDVVGGMPGVTMSSPPPPYGEGFFASDLFHPSAVGYRDWARFALDELEPAW
jgi:lysophospholipase L1-like esterase